MKPELSALVMPASSVSQADQPSLDRQSGQELPAMKNEVDRVIDPHGIFNDPGVFKDSHRGRTIGLWDSASFNRRTGHAALSVVTRKKRFG